MQKQKFCPLSEETHPLHVQGHDISEVKHQEHAGDHFSWSVQWSAGICSFWSNA
jgi:hypothetical protein